MIIFKNNKNDIKKAASLLNQGKLIAFPTETVFGVGCVYDNYQAYKALNKLKRRTPNKPYTLMLSSINEIKKFAILNKLNLAFIKKALPGSVTVIVPAKKGLPKYLAKDGTIGIRIPDYKVTLSLLKLTKPLLVPSLNRSEKKPLNKVNEIKKEFNHELAGLINEKCGGSLPSTIVSLVKNIKIIREGKIPSQKLIKLYKSLAVDFRN